MASAATGGGGGGDVVEGAAWSWLRSGVCMQSAVCVGVPPTRVHTAPASRQRMLCSLVANCIYLVLAWPLGAGCLPLLKVL